MSMQLLIAAVSVGVTAIVCMLGMLLVLSR
jgi:hypothetical protein